MKSPDVLEDPITLNAMAVRAMAAGDPASAQVLLKRALITSNDVSIWLNLAGCRRVLGDIDGALQAVESGLAGNARSFGALLMRASLLERQQRTTEAAAAYGAALTQAPPDEKLDAATLRAVQHGREINRRYVQALSDFLNDRIGPPEWRGTSPEGRRASMFIELLLGRRRRFRQEPTQFFYPGLPAIEFYERESFPFLTDLEACTKAICAEMTGLAKSDYREFVPYIEYSAGVPLDQWAELNHSARWGALHLYKAGVQVEENSSRCPTTMKAVDDLPQPHVRNRSPAAMFSALHSRTRIPPHTGVANTRLVLHLPLIVPPGCGFRVGDETREWRAGEAWVFDDTIEHEAWNDSDQVRVVLICDLWRPDLSLDERQLITTVMESLDDFSYSA